MEALTLGLAGTLLPVINGGTEEFPLAGLHGGDIETASSGDIERTEVDEVFRWKGVSKPEGIVSNFDFRFERAACVEA